jgi:mono/diheme cytochrome c family protein
MSCRVSHMLMLVMFASLGCEDPHNDMGDQEKYLPEKQTIFFADGTSSRPLMPGVVPRDDGDVPGIPYAQHNPAQATRVYDIEPLGASMPIHVTPETIRRGQVEYDAYCSVCHGRLGNGEGIVVQRGFTRPPSFHIERLKKAPDAHFFNVMSNGYGAMFSYSDRVTQVQRWEIIAYIRVLQAAPDVANASQKDRAALIAGGDRATPPTGGGG